MIFRWCGNFKKGHLSEELAPKPGRRKSVMDDQNVATVWTVFHENRRMTCEETAASTNYLKTSIFRVLHNNIRFRFICFGWIPHHLITKQM